MVDYGKLWAEADKRSAGVPEKPDDYKAELPADFKLPDGYEIKTDDPRLAAWRQLAHDLKLPQEAFAAGIALDAQAKIAETQALKEAVAKRDAALGQNGPMRVEALKTWFTGSFGPEVGQQMAQTLWTPGIIQAFEKIQKAITDQGVQGFVQTGRDNSPPDWRPEGFEKMSPIDQLVLARQHKRETNGAAR